VSVEGLGEEVGDQGADGRASTGEGAMAFVVFIGSRGLVDCMNINVNQSYLISTGNQPAFNKKVGGVSQLWTQSKSSPEIDRDF